MSIPMPIASAQSWFSQRGWQPFAFQREVWDAMARGESGVLHATTGSGKTYAVWMGAIERLRARPGLQVLWITPMRALRAGTNEPICAKMAISAFWRIYVDLPPMFGPVTISILLRASSASSFGTKGSSMQRSTTG